VHCSWPCSSCGYYRYVVRGQSTVALGSTGIYNLRTPAPLRLQLMRSRAGSTVPTQLAHWPRRLPHINQVDHRPTVSASSVIKSTRSVRYHSQISTRLWPLTFIFCTSLGHDHSSTGTGGRSVIGRQEKTVTRSVCVRAMTVFLVFTETTTVQDSSVVWVSTG